MTVQKNAKGLYETEIDGVCYEFQVWRARNALKTLIELSAVSGEFLARGAALFDKPNALKQKLDGEALGGLADALIKGLTKDVNNSLNLVERMVTNGVSRDGKEVNFERDFERNFSHLYKVIRAALEVQYGNFFETVKGVASQPAPTTSSTSAT